MKKTFAILTAGLALMTAVSCQKETSWADDGTPEIYFTPAGISEARIWNYDSGSYETQIGVNLCGIRPANQVNSITVSYAVDDNIVTAYNNEITNEFSGNIVALPSDCYTVTGTSVTIEQGEVAAKIPVTFNTKALAALEREPGKKYVLPLRLTGTTMHNLSSDENLTTLMYSVTMEEPSFYFFANKDGVFDLTYKMVYGGNNLDDEYKIAAFGVPEGNYPITVEYDEEALKATHPKETILPKDAYTVVSDNLVYHNERDMAKLVLRYNQDKMEFGKSYFLPLTITSAAPYKANESLKTIYINVQMRNEYEKLYGSVMSVNAESTKRTASYSAKKTPVTYAADMIEMELATKNTIAGAKVDATTSATYNGRLIRIKIIPTADKTHYNIEYVPVTDGTKKTNTPDGFEPIPDTENYYDWMEEKFVLNYRWKHVEKKDTSWVNVSEIMSAK